MRQRTEKAISPIINIPYLSIWFAGLILMTFLPISLAAAGELVLEFYRNSTLIQNPDQTPRLRIYSDGRVIIHYPEYMKHAGMYEIQIGLAEVESILGKLDSKGIGNFDTVQMKAVIATDKGLRKEERGEVYQVSDDTITKIHIMKGLKNSKNGTQHIQWKNIQLDALQHPHISSVQNLADSEKLLLNLIDELMARSPNRID